MHRSYVLVCRMASSFPHSTLALFSFILLVSRVAYTDKHSVMWRRESNQHSTVPLSRSFAYLICFQKATFLILCKETETSSWDNTAGAGCEVRMISYLPYLLLRHHHRRLHHPHQHMLQRWHSYSCPKTHSHLKGIISMLHFSLYLNQNWTIVSIPCYYLVKYPAQHLWLLKLRLKHKINLFFSHHDNHSLVF